MSTSSVELEHVIARLQSILKEVWDEHPVDAPVDRNASLLSLGVDSLTLVTLLDRVEADLQVEWDPDDPPGAYSSLHTIAYLAVGRNRDSTTSHDMRS